VRWFPALLIAVALAGCGGATADRGTPPSVASTTEAPVVTGAPTTPTAAAVPTTTGVAPVGFGTVAAAVVSGGGERCDVCLWLADDLESRGRGLMHVTDLAGRDGMAFVYDAPHTTSFTMRNTVMPLSIAFFAADGSFLDAFDMEPCTEEPCPSYPTPDGFVVAVEAPRGALPALGIGPGSTLELLATGCG
jgi:uncharacterized membrane protein (UPF0127 family)